MVIGSDEWIKQTAMDIAEESMPLLLNICESAANQHQIAHLRLDPANAARVGLYLVQVQEESFKLGLRLALKLVQDLMDVD